MGRILLEIALVVAALVTGFLCGRRNCWYVREQLQRVESERNAVRAELRWLRNRLNGRLEERRQNAEGG